MHWREQGDWGELSAASWLVQNGYHVYLPFGHAPDCDMIADRDGTLIRVQVKTSQCVQRDRWQLTVCTRGGNQSWNGIVKRFSANRCDYLFAQVADGRCWFIPVASIKGGTSINLGGPKYAGFEVAPGRPFPATEWV